MWCRRPNSVLRSFQSPPVADDHRIHVGTPQLHDSHSPEVTPRYVDEILAGQRLVVGDTIVVGAVTDHERLATILAECGHHVLLDTTVEHYLTRRLPPTQRT